MSFQEQLLEAAVFGEHEQLNLYLNSIKYILHRLFYLTQPFFELALYESATEGEAKSLVLLIPFVENINAKSISEEEQGRTALHIAARRGHPKCVEVLLGNGAVVELQDGIGYTALRYAAGGQEREEEYTECAKLLINANADVNKKFPDEVSILMVAALASNHSRIRLLLPQVEDLYETDWEGKDVMFYARMLGDQEQKKIIEDYLSAHPRPVELRDGDLAPIPTTVTPPPKKPGAKQESAMEFPVEFITAASEGEVDNVTSYLDPVKYAEEWDAVEQDGLKQQLLILAFIEAAEYGHLEVLKLLRPYVKNINIHDDLDKAAALHKAAAGGFPDCVDYLLQEGASVDSMPGGYTPLWYAVESDSPKKSEDYTNCVRLLVAAGADVNRTFHNGVTICMIAIIKSNPSRIEFLLPLFNNLYAENSYGNGLLDCISLCSDEAQRNIVLDYLKTHPTPVEQRDGDLAPPPTTVPEPSRASSVIPVAKVEPSL